MPEKKTLWQKTKNWAKSNQVAAGVIAGAGAGGAATVLVGGVGAIPGAIVGGVAGYWNHKTQKENK